MSDLLEKTNDWGVYGYATKDGRKLRINQRVRVVWPDGIQIEYQTAPGFTVTQEVWDHGHNYPASQQSIPVIEIEHHGAIVPLLLDGLEAYLVEEPGGENG